jgi:hypothetical protein
VGVRGGSDDSVVTVVGGGANNDEAASDTGLLMWRLVLLLLHIIALGGAEMRQALSIAEWKSFRELVDMSGVIVISVVKTLSWEQEFKSTSKTSSSEHGLLLEKFEFPFGRAEQLNEPNGDESNAKVGLKQPKCTIVGGL